MTESEAASADQTQPIGSRHPGAGATRTAVLDQGPDVRAFVAAVRARLADLTEEEREELVGGLDADMGDLVAERGAHALPDPATYAAELRAAAGFGPEAPARDRRGSRERVMAWLDRGSATWGHWVATGDHLGLPAFAQTLRPVWWVLRALCATVLVHLLVGLVNGLGVLALVAIVISVQIGRGAWWPGTVVHRSLFWRAVLIGLNLLAVLVLPVVLAVAERALAVGPSAGAGSAVYHDDRSGEPLTFRGEQVRNVYPYDAQGRPLTGIQLVDDNGARLTVARDMYDETAVAPKVLAPWMNGRTELYSVFPLPERAMDPETGAPVGEPSLQAPPFASLSPVTLEGVLPSVLLPSPAVRDGATQEQEVTDGSRGKQNRKSENR